MNCTFLLLIAAALPAFAEGGGEPGDGILFERSQGLQAMDSIEGALASFRALTEGILEEAGLSTVGDISETTPYVSIHPSLLESVGHTWWEEQNIGFANWPRCLRGVIESQQLRILELERRVAELEGAGSGVLADLDSGIEEQSAVVESIAGEGWVD